jgi:hypothetical protein
MHYGEIHAGDAVMVSVTEEMNPAIQIKADDTKPENIPVLKLNAVRKFMIPGTVYAHLAHQPMKPQPAIAVLDSVAEKCLEGSLLVRYELKMPEAQRTLRIYFEKDFPYRIQKWEDFYRGLAGMGSQAKTTRAVRTHTIMDAYWRHHGNRDRALLKNLGLKPREMESH